MSAVYILVASVFPENSIKSLNRRCWNYTGILYKAIIHYVIGEDILCLLYINARRKLFI